MKSPQQQQDFKQLMNCRKKKVYFAGAWVTFICPLATHLTSFFTYKLKQIYKLSMAYNLRKHLKFLKLKNITFKVKISSEKLCLLNIGLFT